MKNYHTHTPRCHHAIGKEEEYILNAIEGGITELGFSDHTPWLYNSSFTSSIRMLPQELDNYVSTLKYLRDKYQDQISIKIGLEAEYFPDYLPWLEKVVKEKELDYLILGNHYDESDEYGIYFGFDLEYSQLVKYVDSVIKAIDTGLFSYVAHPDLANYDNRDEKYIKEYTRLCKYAKDKHIPLEFNLLGYVGKRHYPNPVFWQIVSEIGNEVIIGYDAHEPYRLKDINTYNKAIAYLKSIDIEPIDTIKFLR